jgi:hypothetical protein
MENDFWRQWQAFAALMTKAPATPDAAAGATPGAFGFAPFALAAERFKQAAQSFLNVGADATTPAPADAARAFADSLREQFEGFVRAPWTSDGGGAPAGAAAAVQAPAFGGTREHQQRWQRAADAWRRMEEAQRRLQRLWSDALRDAATAFAARGAPQARTAAPASAAALQDLYDAWIDCAEEAYARMAHGEAFCDAQADFVNASSQWREAIQESIEHWSKPLDLPTRSEVNSLTRRLESLERELRAARKPPDNNSKSPRHAAKSPGNARTAPGGSRKKKSSRRKST